jgi:hypothetical protein
MAGKTLTMVCTDSTPLGFDVGPPVFRLDECPARPEREHKIAAITA